MKTCFISFIAFCLLCQFAFEGKSATYPGEKGITVDSGSQATFALKEFDQPFAVLVYLPSVREVEDGDALAVTISDAVGVVVRKTLHAGDPDFYVTLRPRAPGQGKIEVRASPSATRPKTYHLRVYAGALGTGGKDPKHPMIAALPASDWRGAQEFELGQTVYASNDERPYLPRFQDAALALEDLAAGAQWFTFKYTGPGSKLVHFIVDILDRDVPVDVSLFVRDGEGPDSKMVAWSEGIERYNTEQSTKFHGLQKFIARVIKPGTYWVRVMGNHPVYRLRAELYDLPPYTDPAKAIRTGMDYLVRKGDSWQADVPRRGSVVLRNSNRLGETAQCIACHPTHFTTRAELIAIENGWPLRERLGLQFLTERLYNNPRPLYGQPDFVWARMISAPGNVLSRLAEMLVEYEKNVSGETRAGLLDPIGNFLEKYWTGVESPITESNGNQPRVSGFEVALHSGLVFAELHRRTGSEKYLELHDRVEEVAATGKPIDMIDLCWKTVALAEFDRSKHAAAIDQLVAEIFAQQKTNGTWSVAFNSSSDREQKGALNVPMGADGTPKQSEFQTYHALYALAKAGVQASDPRVEKSIRWCLSRQWSHGGWQGNSDFKNFDTVFRDTQFAVMALSEFYKGPDFGKETPRWSATVSREELNSENPASLLEAMDRCWTDPGTAIRSSLRQRLKEKQPLVRAGAAMAAGRIADAEAVDDLVLALGDGSKLVQRSAAWALRQIASRRGVGQDQILAALSSDDDRTRSGAVRVFNQHFKYLTGHWPLAQALIERAQSDPVPMNRIQAVQALWQWWFWEKSDEHKSALEDVFIAGLGKPEESWVRRNWIEGFHNLLDDNLRYLRNDWIPALKSEVEKERVRHGQAATALRQAGKISDALAQGNDLQRDGLLRSFYAFHLRESSLEYPRAVADFQFPETFVFAGKAERGENTWLDGYKFAAAFDPCRSGEGLLGRIGNDTEPPTYSGESGALLATQLRRLVEENAKEFLLPVLKMYRGTRDVPVDAAFSALLIKLAASDANDFSNVNELLREQLPAKFTAAPESVEALGELIGTADKERLRLASLILSQAHATNLAGEPVIASAIAKRFESADSSAPAAEAILELTTASAALDANQSLRARLFDWGRSAPAPLRGQVLRAILSSERLLMSERKEIDRDLRDANASRMKDWLAAATAVAGKKNKPDRAGQMIVSLLTAGLTHPDAAVKTTAIESIGKTSLAQESPAVIEALRWLGKSEEGKVRDLALAQLERWEKAKSGKAPLDRPTPDFDYFVQNVQPIFERVAADGDSCARCHANHSILRLISPGDGESLSPEQLRTNYLSVLKVVNLNEPEESLLLIKPRSSFEGIGQPEKYLSTHGGDVRWSTGKESEEYKTILRWIQGVKASVARNP